MARTFHVELIKPSHYDDDGDVIQWYRSSIPSNSVARVHSLIADPATRHYEDEALRPTGKDAEIPNFVRGYADNIPHTHGAATLSTAS